MSRELMSFPIVNPTIAPDELITSASSGSGTFQRASLPDPDGLAWRDDLFRKRLEEDLRPLGIVDAVVGARAELGFHHSGFPASEIGHTGGPHLLGFDRRQQPDAVERMRCQSGRAETHELVCEVGSFEEALHAMHAGIRQIEESLTVRDQPDADVAPAAAVKPHSFMKSIVARSVA